MRKAFLFAAALAVGLAGCSKPEPQGIKGAPLTRVEGSTWTSYDDAEILGAIIDKNRGEVLIKSAPCKTKKGRETGGRMAIAVNKEGRASFGCWLDASSEEDDYVFVGWYYSKGETYDSPQIAAYNYKNIRWTETGAALVSVGKALKETKE